MDYIAPDELDCQYHVHAVHFNQHRVSKHSVTVLPLRVVTTSWSWACTNRTPHPHPHTPPAIWVGLGSPLAEFSVYGDLTCSVHTVNNLSLFKYQLDLNICHWGPYIRLAFMPNMLSSWNKVIIIITPKRPQQITHAASDISLHLFRVRTEVSACWIRCLLNGLQKL